MTDSNKEFLNKRLKALTARRDHLEKRLSEGKVRKDEIEDVKLRLEDAKADLAEIENRIKESDGAGKPADSPPQADVSKSNASKAPTSSTSAKISKLEADKAKIAKEQLEMEEMSLKNSAKLEKAITKLIESLKAGNHGSEKYDPNSADAPGAKPKSKSLLDALKQGKTDYVKNKVDSIKQMASGKGIAGLLASKVAPTGIMGALTGAAFEHYSAKDDAKKKKEAFHEGFVQTEAGESMLSKIKSTEKQKLIDSNFSGDVDKQAEKNANVIAKKRTASMYESKSEKDDEIAKIDAEESKLKSIDKNFTLSKKKQERRDELSVKSNEISKYGTETETDLEAKHRLAKSAVDNMAEHAPKDVPLTVDAAKTIFDGAMKELNALSEQQLEQLKQINDHTEPSEEDKLDAAKVEPAKADISPKPKDDKEKKPGIIESIKNKVTDFLGRGKGILNRGKDIVGSVGRGVSSTGSIISKGASAAKTGTGALLSGAGTLARGIPAGIAAMGGLGPMALGAAGVAAAGAAGYGVGTLINDHLLTNEDGSNKIANLFTSDAEKNLEKENAAYAAREAARANVKKVNKIPPPVDVAKNLEKQPVDNATPNTTRINDSRQDLIDKRKANLQSKADTQKVIEGKVEKPPVPDRKEEIDTKTSEVEAAKAKPVVVAAPPPVAPIITTNNNNTTNVVRPTVRNTEPSFNNSLARNFI